VDRPAALTLAAASVLTLAAMIHWSSLATRGAIGESDLREHPLAHHAEPVVLSLFRVSAVDGARAVVSRGTLDLAVTGAPGLRVGEEVTISGTFDGHERVVRVATVRHHPARGQKRWLGLVAVGVVLVGAPLTLRRTGRGLSLRGGRQGPGEGAKPASHPR
jgi:hypothetical protein